MGFRLNPPEGLGLRLFLRFAHWSRFFGRLHRRFLQRDAPQLARAELIQNDRRAAIRIAYTAGEQPPAAAAGLLKQRHAAQGVVFELEAGRQRVGVTAGASAPEVLVNEVIDRLRSFGVTALRQDEGARENVSFPLPLELQR